MVNKKLNIEIVISDLPMYGEGWYQANAKIQGKEYQNYARTQGRAVAFLLEEVALVLKDRNYELKVEDELTATVR
jgi:hypothetical protein